MLLSPDQLSHAEVITDFDSSAVTVESLDAFGEYVLADAPDGAARLAELEALTAQGMNGDLPFDVSLEARLELFDAHYFDVARFAERIVRHISPSALEHREWFAANAERIHIVSGGFEPFIRPVAARLGLLGDHVHGNQFIFDRDGKVVGYDASRATAQAGGKAAHVEALCLVGPVIAIGDGHTDREIRLSGAADEFWALTETVARPKVVAGADRVVASYAEVVRLESGVAA